MFFEITRINKIEILIKKLVGVDAVFSTDDMRENFPPGLDRGLIALAFLL